MVWLDFRLIPGVGEALAKLRKLGKRVFFVTNNSTKSRAQFAKLFGEIGVGGVTEANILGSSYAAACKLASLRTY